MSGSMQFGKHLLIAAVAGLLDYLVGRLSNTLSWGIACSAVLILIASAGLDYLNATQYTQNTPGVNSVLDVIRFRMGPSRRPSVLNAVFAGVLAVAASCAFTLAVVTFRFCAAHGNLRLGKNLSFDHPVIVFIGNFQASSATAWLFVACTGLALFIPWRLVVLPAGVAAVAVADAMFIGIPPLSHANHGWYSQVAYTLGSLDGWLFRLPPVAVPLACVIPALIGAVACSGISKLLSLADHMRSEP